MSYQRRSAARWARSRESRVAHPVVRVGARARRARCARAARCGRAGRAGRGRHDGHRTPAAARGGTRRCVARRSLPSLARSAQPARRGGRRDRSRSPSAFLDEVDSFNPFLGLRGAVVRDVGADLRLHGRLLDGGHVAGAGAGDVVGDLRGRPDLDLRHPRGRRRGPTASRSPPPTSPTPTTGSSTAAPRPATGATYLTSVETVTAPDDTTVVLELVEAERRAAAAADPDPARAHLEGRRREDEVKTYRAEPTDGQPVVGSGPFRLVEGTAGGSTYRFEANPDYWGGAPHVDEVVVPGLQERGPRGPGADQGRGRLRRRHHRRSRSRRSQGRDGHHRAERRLAVLRGDRLQHRRGRHRDRRAARRRQPGAAGPDVPARARLRARHRPARRERLPGRRGSRATRSSRRPTPTCHWEPPEDEAFTFDLDKAGELLDEAGYEMGSDGCAPCPTAAPIGTLRLFARSRGEALRRRSWTSSRSGSARSASSPRSRAMESNQLTDGSSRATTTSSTGAGTSSPTRTASSPTSPATQRGGSSDSWYCNEEYDALYAAAERRDRRREAGRDRQADAGDLYEDSPYLVTAYTADRRGGPHRPVRLLPAAAGPGRRLLVQYGARNYTLLRPADEAGDCDGVDHRARRVRRRPRRRRTTTASATPLLIGGARAGRAASSAAW